MLLLVVLYLLLSCVLLSVCELVSCLCLCLLRFVLVFVVVCDCCGWRY